MVVQKSSLTSEVVEVAVRGNSIEINRNFGRYSAVRVAGTRWAIVSANDKKFDEIVEKAKRLAGSGNEIELADAEMAVGEFRMGKGYFDEETAVEILKDIEREFGRVEAILTYEKTLREIWTDDGADAREERVSVDLNVSVMGKGVASIHIGGLGGLEVLEEGFGFLMDELRRRIGGLERAKYLNPLMRGSKFEVILSKEAACAFIHEVVHCLEADVSSVRIKDGSEITIYDDPNGFGGYSFDDEGVVARRKCLVDGGRIISYLHTRESAKRFGVSPEGNGRGLFTIPKAFQTNLVVSPGDWSVDEMIEETREGFLAEGVVRAEICGDYIEIRPELCWYIKGGEISCPAVLRGIRVPLREALLRVKAIGREVFERISYEKGFPISERSPPIAVEANVT